LWEEYDFLVLLSSLHGLHRLNVQLQQTMIETALDPAERPKRT
jgi:hypothetical protein